MREEDHPERRYAPAFFAAGLPAYYSRSMSTDQEKLLEEALRLPPEARAAFAARLIESLDTEIDPDAEAAWASEIERRVAEIDSGKVRLIPWSEARKQILDASGRG